MSSAEIRAEHAKYVLSPSLAQGGLAAPWAPSPYRSPFWATTPTTTRPELDVALAGLDEGLTAFEAML